MATRCKNCGEGIVCLATTDGVGWYHPISRDKDEYVVRESCNADGLGFPCAEPPQQTTPEKSESQSDQVE